MEEPELWRWVWLVVAVSFGLGEMMSPGSFFLAPFAAGAAVAAAASFLGAPVPVSWLLFLAVSVVAFASLRPLARRLDAKTSRQLGVGAQRLIGEQGVVLRAVPDGPDELGLIRVGREEWRAQSAYGQGIAPNTVVAITEVKGTRVVVLPIGPTTPTLPIERPDG